MNHDEMVQKINDLSDMIQFSNSNTQYVINWMIAIISIFVGIFAIGGPKLIKFWVNQKVNEELDKRLLSLLEANPSIFSTMGHEVPDQDNRIYFKSSIKGIEQLTDKSAIFISIDPEHKTFADLENSLIPNINNDPDGQPYMEIKNYHKNNGEISYFIQWRRTKFIKPL